MLSGCFVILILIDIQLYYASSTESDELNLPDYGYHWTKKPELSKKLTVMFISKKKSEEMLRNLKHRIANDTEYYDDIPHFEIGSTRKIKHQATIFEKDFQRIIGMIGVQYNYKRDMHWRTWREVAYPNKTKEVVCYRSHIISIVNGSQAYCSFCNTGGYWSIEDKPPSCSFEILSFKDDQHLCVANYWQLNKENVNSCPSIITLQELSFCQIPLLTRLKVYPDYSTNISERSPADICKRREECKITTLYKIASDIIAFNIINATNDIIYSRHMKNNGKIYVCIEDCGRIDLNTMETKRVAKHVVLDMLNYPAKKKREDASKSKTIRQNGRSQSKIHAIRRNLFNNRREYIMEQPLQALYYPVTTVSYCRQMILRQLTD